MSDDRYDESNCHQGNLRLTIHSVFCGTCGGWAEPESEKLGPHHTYITCFKCGDDLLRVGLVEPEAEWIET